jgi:FlaA1/EpsC-like NDP-sugar epimerase
MLGLVRGSLMGVIASVVAVLYLTRFEGYSRLVFAFDALLAPVLLIAARVTFNGLDQYLRVRRTRGRTALIYGAGRAGALAVRELLQNSSIGLSPIGFMDDDPAKRRLRMDGLAVVTSFDHLAAYLDQSPGRVGAIVVAIGSLSPERFDALCAICASREVAVQRMRFSIEDVRRRAGSEHVVAFPRQPAR